MAGGAGIDDLHNDRDAGWSAAATAERSGVLNSEAGRFVTLGFGFGARWSNVMGVKWCTLCFVTVKNVR